MFVLTEQTKMFAELCRLRKQFGLYLSFPEVPADMAQHDLYMVKIRDMHPLMGDDAGGAMWTGSAMIFTDTHEEIEALYGKTHGDDGPCEASLECRNWHVYALTCDPWGQFMTENT